MQTTSETNDPVLYLAWSMHGSAEAPAGCLSSMKEKRKRFMIFYRSLTRNTRNHNCNICDQSKHFIYLFIWLMACCAVSLWNIEVKWLSDFILQCCISSYHIVNQELMPPMVLFCGSNTKLMVWTSHEGCCNTQILGLTNSPRKKMTTNKNSTI